jgi:hypothetical protein
MPKEHSITTLNPKSLSNLATTITRPSSLGGGPVYSASAAAFAGSISAGSCPGTLTGKGWYLQVCKRVGGGGGGFTSQFPIPAHTVGQPPPPQMLHATSRGAERHGGRCGGAWAQCRCLGWVHVCRLLSWHSHGQRVVSVSTQRGGAGGGGTDRGLTHYIPLTKKGCQDG